MITGWVVFSFSALNDLASSIAESGWDRHTCAIPLSATDAASTSQNEPANTTYLRTKPKRVLIVVRRAATTDTPSKVFQFMTLVGGLDFSPRVQVELGMHE